MTKDPILFGGGDTNLFGYVGTVGKVPSVETNLYGYSFQDPVNFIDPSGLWAEEWIADRYSPSRQAAIGAFLATTGAWLTYQGYSMGFTPAGLPLIGLGLALGIEGTKNIVKANQRGLNPIQELFNPLDQGSVLTGNGLRCGR